MRCITGYVATRKEGQGEMIEKETLEKYRDNGHTLADTATALGITYYSAQHYCKKYGITFRGNYQPKPDEHQPVKKQSAEKQTKLNAFYKKVVQIRQHMSRLAKEERYYLNEITKIEDEA